MRLESLSLIGQWLECPCKDLLVTDFAFDSRAVHKTGTLFFALKGARQDGHDFLREAKKQGAIAAVVDRSYRGETADLVLLPVDDVKAALQHLAKQLQQRREQRIIAVTGSVGKTTTKEFIATLLSEKYTVAKTPGNSNSQVGAPLAILKASGEEEVFIIEMGMTHLHEIETLVQIAPPEMSVITKIGYSHVDTVPGGLPGIATAKAEILAHPKTQWAVIEHGAFQYDPIQKTGHAKKITYGSLKADVFLDTEHLPHDRGKEGPFIRLPFSETHFCENFIGAVAVARVMGLSWEEIVHASTKLKAIPLRFEKIHREGALFINDCYNASPESMESALQNLPCPSFGGKTIAVLGEMSTLGKFSEEGHQRIGHIALQKIDHLLCYGKRCLPMIELFEAAGRPAELHHNLQNLKSALSHLSKPGDVVLIKGSNSNALWHLLGG